jgi:hypothetical protein
MAAREVLFYAECEMQGMIATNKELETLKLPPRFTELDFSSLAERTRQCFRQAIEM